jgi:hypothetical protein
MRLCKKDIKDDCKQKRGKIKGSRLKLTFNEKKSKENVSIPIKEYVRR